MKYILYILASFSFLPLSAQDLAQRLSTQLQEAVSQTYYEKVYLHTNSQFLISGEVLYFKVYCVQASTHKPSKFSQIAYIELINEANSPVLQSKIKLTQGQGAGDFFIPSSLPSGNYTLIAYTKWMRNFEIEKVFQRNITLVNPFQKLKNNQSIRLSKDLAIQFFPEGGQLVQGIQNTLAYRVVNSQGKGINFKGKIVDEQGNTVQEFSPFRHGLGKFSFTPQAGQKYQAIIIDSLEQFHFQEIPPIQTEGLAISVNEQSNHFEVQFQGNFSGNLKEGCLLVHQKNKTILSNPLNFSNQRGQIQIDKKSLPPGISIISIFNSLGQPLGERLIFNYPQNYPRISTIIPRSSLKPRSAVTLDLSIENLPSTAKVANLSISVRKQEVNFNQPSTLKSYFLLGSALKGGAKYLDTYLQNPKSSNRQVLDLVMLTHGWRAFSWQSLSQAATSMPPALLPDFRGELISGILRRKDNQEAVPNHLVFLSVPARDFQFYASKTDQNGRFHFNTKQVYNEVDIIIKADDNAEGQYELTLDKDFLGNYENFTPQRLFLDSNQQVLIKNRSIQAQIENAYYIRKNDSIVNLQAAERFYRNPDVVYHLDDYTRFPSMIDIIRENIVGVVIRKKKDDYYFKAKTDVTGTGVEKESLVLIDGLPLTNNHNAIAEYNQAKVESIEIIADRFLYGPLDVKGGVISFHTFKGDLEEFPLSPYLIQKKHIGIQPKKIYFSPVYDKAETQTSRIPDFRTQLYWNPSKQINLDESNNITFYTSDDTGSYELCIEGMLDTGEFLYIKKTFEVKEKL